MEMVVFEWTGLASPSPSPGRIQNPGLEDLKTFLVEIRSNMVAMKPLGYQQSFLYHNLPEIKNKTTQSLELKTVYNSFRKQFFYLYI